MRNFSLANLVLTAFEKPFLDLSGQLECSRDSPFPVYSRLRISRLPQFLEKFSRSQHARRIINSVQSHLGLHLAKESSRAVTYLGRLDPRDRVWILNRKKKEVTQGKLDVEAPEVLTEVFPRSIT